MMEAPEQTDRVRTGRKVTGKITMYKLDFKHPVHVYFVGIGGISMSGLAEILSSEGFRGSGSDRQESAMTRRLNKLGIRVLIGQREENITPDIDVAVFTAAIHPDNPEYKAVQKLGIPSLTRAQLLGQIMDNYPMSAAVSGTHGKTTTTSMLSEILLEGGTDPTLSIGGIYDRIGGNILVGHSGSFVTEACEYTNSFLSLYPEIGIILDIDADHLDFFKDLADIRRSFHQFASQIHEGGTLILNSDIEHPEEITDGVKAQVVTYGSSPESDYYPTDITYDELGHPTYTLHTAHPRAGVPAEQRIKLSVPGEHNVYNSIAAAAAGDLYGVDRKTIAAALLQYKGTERRFEFKGERDGVTIIDDYAHHPTEIAATIHAARKLHKDRVIVAFMPHTYTRTKALMKAFAKSLSLADEVLLADIFPARETDTLGISSQTLADEIHALGHSAVYLGSFSAIEDYVKKNCRKNDLLITMGAGNIDTVADDLLS